MTYSPNMTPHTSLAASFLGGGGLEEDDEGKRDIR